MAAVLHTAAAWDLIGFGGNASDLSYLADVHVEAAPASVRVKGGRVLYEAVDNFGGQRVRLARLDADFRQVNRYVDADTVLEVVAD